MKGFTEAQRAWDNMCPDEGASYEECPECEKIKFYERDTDDWVCENCGCEIEYDDDDVALEEIVSTLVANELTETK